MSLTNSGGKEHHNAPFTSSAANGSSPQPEPPQGELSLDELAMQVQLKVITPAQFIKALAQREQEAYQNGYNIGYEAGQIKAMELRHPNTTGDK